MKRILLVMGVSAFILAGCASTALSITPDEGAIPDCARGHDPIPVTTLDVSRRAHCRLAGVALVFPDGKNLYVNRGATSGASTDGNEGQVTEYTFYSVGIYGFVAGFARSGCREMQEWGSPIAKAKVREAFGKSWACPSASVAAGHLQPLAVWTRVREA